MFRSSRSSRVPGRSPPAPAARRHGFSLIETLVALSLVALALLWTLSLIFQEPRVLRRVAAHEEALRALEATLEAVRAGRRVPPGREPVDLAWFSAPEEPAAEDLRLWSERQVSSPGGLYRLTLTARYRVGSQRFQRQVETRVWTP